jgi:hypothetical protein
MVYCHPFIHLDDMQYNTYQSSLAFMPHHTSVHYVATVIGYFVLSYWWVAKFVHEHCDCYEYCANYIIDACWCMSIRPSPMATK